MAKFALVDNNIITQVIIADSEAGLGTLGQLFETVQVEGLEPEPARGWERVDGVWHPPVSSDAAKEAWHGAGYNEKEETEEVKKVEAPKEEKKAGK